MKKIASITGLFVIMLTLLSFTLTDEWLRIGAATAESNQKELEINIRQYDTPYHELLIAVAKTPVKIEKMEIKFKDGSSDMIEVNTEFNDDAFSKAIDLTNNSREISTVVMTFSPIGSNGTAVFQVWGR